MGSGKGRVLLMASRFGFRRVIGVEFADELHLAATSNAAAAHAHGLHIEPILGDAAEFRFPVDPLVVYFNNPFSEGVMERVIANLSSSYEARRRPLVLVYQQLTIEDEPHRTRNIELLGGCPFLSGCILETRGLYDRYALRAYTVALFRSPEALEFRWPKRPRTRAIAGNLASNVGSGLVR
jgi:hypothetical protein